MKRFRAAILGVVVALAAAMPARAQVPGQPLVPLGYCQLTGISASTGLASCSRASFTGTGNGTNLTVAAINGEIVIGDTISGTGVPAGTTITGQVNGTPGGNGVYTTSAATTSSSNALTTTGIPPGATSILMQSETANVRWRDDGGTPTSTIGMLLVTTAPTLQLYNGTLANLRFISATGLVDVAFYR